MFSARFFRRLGWICFTLMWIPFIGIFIGMAGMPEGSYDWVELPLVARISIVGAGVFFALSSVFLTGSMLLGAIQNRFLLANGQAATATIREIQSTGQTVNDYYVGMSFLLDVTPTTEPSFQARAEKLVPMHMLAQYAVGGSVQVRFNPNSKVVAIVDEISPQG